MTRVILNFTSIFLFFGQHLHNSFFCLKGHSSLGFSEFNDILIDEIKVNERYLLNATSNTISDFKYYPNPVKKLLTIESSEQITLVLIYSILGQKIYSLKPESIFKFDVDVSNLPNGTYMVKALSDNKLHNFKIIIDAE